jgi:hypothetical protein
VVFDGKVGLYPIVETILAIRNSIHRKMGTEIIKAMSMTEAVYHDFVLNKLLPDIVQCCPPEMRRNKIFIQHDNAPPHKTKKDLLNWNVQSSGLIVNYSTNQRKFLTPIFVI